MVVRFRRQMVEPASRITECVGWPRMIAPCRDSGDYCWLVRGSHRLCSCERTSAGRRDRLSLSIRTLNNVDESNVVSLVENGKDDQV